MSCHPVLAPMHHMVLIIEQDTGRDDEKNTMPEPTL